MIANVGDKFVVEVEEVYRGADGPLYRMKGFNSLVFDDNGLKKLTRLHCINDYDVPFAVGDVVILLEEYYGVDTEAVVIEVTDTAITILDSRGRADVVCKDEFNNVIKQGSRVPQIDEVIDRLREIANGSK